MPDAPDAEQFGLAWPGAFFAYQTAGIGRLLRESSVLLADEMGLGKTVQAIAAIRILLRRGEAQRALIVCPAGLTLQWRRQIRHWAPDLKLATVVGSAEQRATAWRANASLYVASYETLRSDLTLRFQEAPGQRLWDIAVIDEAQRIKNRDADVARAVKSLNRRRAWALTGTPLENRLEDLVSILEFVAPGRFDPSAMVVGLRRLLAEVQLRRLRRNVLHDLPPKLASTVLVELGPNQRNAYRQAEEAGIVHLKSLGVRLRVTHVLELILRLKQICNFCPETGDSAKLSDLRERIAGAVAAGEKALVFSQFVEEPFGARRLDRELAAFAPVLLTGDVDPISREARIAEFERDAARQVMVLSLRAGGVGLNLAAASFVFHFDRGWNPELEAQAEDRTHRIGQGRRVQVFAYLSAGTIEERIDEILSEKRAMFSDIVDGVDANMLRRLDVRSLLRAAGVARSDPIAR